VSDSIPRRAVLKSASLGVVAGVAATTGLGRLPELFSGSKAKADAEEADLSPVGTNVVAHIRNASTGEIAILAGDREIIRNDPALVSRLLRVARATGKEL
jgi:hypothetical protein